MFVEDIRIEAEHELLDGGTFTAGRVSDRQYLVVERNNIFHCSKIIKNIKISYFIKFYLYKPTSVSRSYCTVTNTNVEFTGVKQSRQQKWPQPGTQANTFCPFKLLFWGNLQTSISDCQTWISFTCITQMIKTRDNCKISANLFSLWAEFEQA